MTSASKDYEFRIERVSPDECRIVAVISDHRSHIVVEHIGDDVVGFNAIKQWIQQWKGWSNKFQTSDRSYTLSAIMPNNDAIIAKLRWG